MAAAAAAIRACAADASCLLWLPGVGGKEPGSEDSGVGRLPKALGYFIHFLRFTTWLVRCAGGPHLGTGWLTFAELEKLVFSVFQSSDRSAPRRQLRLDRRHSKD
eukprot:scaffold10262_cov69-Phaeocystis_antarctica.AAC.1